MPEGIDDLLFREFRPLHGAAPFVRDHRSCQSTLVLSCRRFRGRRQPVQLTKDQAHHIKTGIARCEEAVSHYTRLLAILREVADGLAFTYLDRFDIKPMAFKDSPGFLSGKSGSRLERQFLRDSFKDKNIAILNDLTNCLRYGDVTVIDRERRVRIAEIKSGKNVTKRDLRQRAATEKMSTYFKNDIVDELYGFKVPIRRISLANEEKHRRNDLNALLASSLEGDKSCYLEVEQGLFYLIEKEANSLLPEIIKQIRGRPLVALINEYKQNNTAYYPFTLSVTDPDHLFQFYAGEFVIVVVVDSEAITSAFHNNDLTFELLPDGPWALTIRSSKGGDEPVFKVSSHFWARLAVEFLSLEWFLAEIITYTQGMFPEKIKNSD
ncbi:MAG: hypothetical protein LZF62_450052 [Nitrospira sp.]|nr:MAG: hypothetical protein LZF62_450052 [Nitrospira sp.]